MTEKTTGTAVEPRNYARWARIIVSVLTFGMVFPNAIIEGMDKPVLPPYLADDAKKS